LVRELGWLRRGYLVISVILLIVKAIEVGTGGH
jgi:hypothetical protein